MIKELRQNGTVWGIEKYDTGVFTHKIKKLIRRAWKNSLLDSLTTIKKLILEMFNSH
jgi:hypothetical protein